MTDTAEEASFLWWASLFTGFAYFASSVCLFDSTVIKTMFAYGGWAFLIGVQTYLHGKAGVPPTRLQYYIFLGFDTAMLAVTAFAIRPQA